MAILAAIIESSDDAIISKQLNGTITSWNKGAENIFGYTETEAIGQHISLIIPKDRLEEEEMIISQLKQGKRIEHYQTHRVTKSGKKLFYHYPFHRYMMKQEK
jgi:PAS domain S-box-containing protein